MSCPTPRDRLWAWVHGEEDEQAAAEIGRHVAACPDCASSVAEMRALLDELRSLCGGASVAVQAAEGPVGIPERIGPYRILRKLGEGGMGVVFEAEQPSPRRRVALKVIRGATWSDAYRARLFRREMQTLARLNHPAIAAIYDAGSTPDGQPYYAMELVGGVSLAQYAEGRRRDVFRPPLTLRERLELLHRVGEAVSYAHQRGVIHRDLKPSNILVDAVGNPKILDFGLARVTEADDDASTVLSEGGRLVGTLAYMSPEQARGDGSAVDVRTDVYALGAILFELLTGRLPHPVAGKALHDIVRTICEETAPDVRAENPRVPAEVAAIVGMALEKDLDRRYPTVAALTDDLQRYLTNRPVLARGPGKLYRLRKLVVRHKLPIALLSALFLVVTGAAIGLGVLASRLRVERDIAQEEAEKFARINAVLEGFLAAPNPWEQGSKDARVLDVLDATAERIEREVADRPLVAAALRQTLGNTYRAFSTYEEAERHLHYAWSVRRGQLGEGHLDTLAARHDLGELLYEAGKTEEAAAALQEALTGRIAALPGDDPQVAHSLNAVGLAFKALGNFPKAEDHLQRALAMRKRLIAEQTRRPGPPRAELAAAYNALAQTLNNLATLRRTQAEIARAAGRHDEAARHLAEARPYYEQALGLRRTWLGPTHPEVAKMLNNYARCLQDLGDLPAAESLLREALGILRQELGEEHRFTARAMYNLAALLRDRGDHPAARAMAQSALAIQQKVLDANDPQLHQTRRLLGELAPQ